MDRLKEKVCIITGVSEPGGIGFGIAKVFAREGATVICVVRRSIVLERVKELVNAGYTALGFVADLSKADEVADMVSKVLAKFGKIDVLINVAGGREGVRADLIEMAEEEWNRVIEANLKTCMLCTRAVLPCMIQRRGGKIVNISSVTGPKVSLPRSTAYAASKGAVSAFTKALALDVAEFGITVNSICPGYVETGVFPPQGEDTDIWAISVPMKRLGKPEEVGYLALFLSIPESDYITGQDIVLDGGNILQEKKRA